ncbi:MAG: carboxypeptidase regulatory-like domain-containing protein [Chitinophagaceae bacterium]|nr:carboxypeptidase regulatory-like domain-containing protein [Chitinophagaceae bacterium]
MKKKFFTLLIIIPIIILVGFASKTEWINWMGDNSSARINGNIYRHYSRNGGLIDGPLANANVQIHVYKEGTPISRSLLMAETTTNKNGNFKFLVPPGDFVISFSSPGDGGNKVVSLREGETIEVKMRAYGASTD